MNQRDKDKAETRQRIVEAAFRIFRERGYGQTSMSHISAAAGTSRANLYLHFGSKPLIVKERMAQLEPEIVGLYERLADLEDKSPETLREWLLDDRRTYLQHPAEFEAISAAMAADNEVLREWINLHERIIHHQRWLPLLFPESEERAMKEAHMATLMMSTERIFDVMYLRHEAVMDEDRMLTVLSRQWSALFRT